MADPNDSSGYGAVGDAVSKLDPDARQKFVDGFMGKQSPEEKKQAEMDALKRRMGSS